VAADFGSVTEPVAASAPVTVAAPVAAPAAVAAPAPHGDDLGTFKLTRYYVAEEPSSSTLASVSGDASDGGVTLYDDRGCKKLATVSARFAELLDIEGSGRLADGRTVNVSDSCHCGHSPCYRAMSDSARWGMSALSKPLVPFRTVSVDPNVIPLGTVLYIPELDGMTMPGVAPWGGYVHDGCVVAADVGGHIVGKHIDFFIGRLAYKRELDVRKKMPHVSVYLGGNHCGHGSSVARNAGI
jgi:3D (Asp-Asp-Asp) domain-containing protein